MRFHFQHQLTDILELNRTAREQRFKALLVILFVIALGLVGVWLAIFQGNQPDSIAAFEFAGIFLVHGLAAPWIAGLGAWFFKTTREPFEVEIKLDGVIISSGSNCTELNWKNFRRWYETKNLMVLVGIGDAFAIPKRSCGAADWQNLQEVVRCGLGDPAKN
jgi:YcxB-like protein